MHPSVRYLNSRTNLCETSDRLRSYINMYVFRHCHELLTVNEVDGSVSYALSNRQLIKK